MADPLKHLVDASVSTWLDDCHACDWSPTRLPTWSRRRRDWRNNQPGQSGARPSTRLRRPGQTAGDVWVRLSRR